MTLQRSPSPVAANVRRIAQEKRFRQHEVAAALGFTRQALTRRFSGEVLFNENELRILADLFGVPVSVFFDEEAA